MEDLRKVEKLEKAADQWIEVRMYQLKKGDTFRLTDNNSNDLLGVYYANTHPYKNDEGDWTIGCNTLGI